MDSRARGEAHASEVPNTRRLGRGRARRRPLRGHEAVVPVSGSNTTPYRPSWARGDLPQPSTSLDWQPPAPADAGASRKGPIPTPEGPPRNARKGPIPAPEGPPWSRQPGAEAPLGPQPHSTSTAINHHQRQYEWANPSNTRASRLGPPGRVTALRPPPSGPRGCEGGTPWSRQPGAREQPGASTTCEKFCQSSQQYTKPPRQQRSNMRTTRSPPLGTRPSRWSDKALATPRIATAACHETAPGTRTKLSTVMEKATAAITKISQPQHNLKEDR